MVAMNRNETVTVKQSDFQKEMIKSLLERAEGVHNQQVKLEKDGMLKISSDGRKIGLDQRLMNPMLPDDPNSIINTCVNNVLKIYENGRNKNLVQFIFCDKSTEFVFNDIKDKLIKAGVSENEIGLPYRVADYRSESYEQPYKQVHMENVRVLLGTTRSVETDAIDNVREKVVAAHHLEEGWMQSTIEKRNKAIIKNNPNQRVQIYQYVTEGLDAKGINKLLEPYLEERPSVMKQLADLKEQRTQAEKEQPVKEQTNHKTTDKGER